MASQAHRLASLKSIREDLHGKLQPIRAQLEDLEISENEYSQIVDDLILSMQFLKPSKNATSE